MGAKAAAAKIRNVGILRLKAIKLHEAASPLSPTVQEAQMSFLATPTHSPRTQADDRAALRLQSVFRGNRVRRQLLAEQRAATKIQARFRGQRGRIIAMSIASMTRLHLGISGSPVQCASSFQNFAPH